MKNPQRARVINSVIIDDKIKFFRSFVVSDIIFQAPLIVLQVIPQNIVQNTQPQLMC